MADDAFAWTSEVGWIEVPDREDLVYISIVQPSGEAHYVEFPRGLTPVLIDALTEEADRG